MRLKKISALIVLVGLSLFWNQGFAALKAPKALGVPSVAVLDTPYEFSFSNEWGTIIKELQAPHDIVMLNVAGVGGIAITIQKVINEVRSAEGMGSTVIMDVDGDVYSGHSFLVCYGSKFMLEPGVSMHFHLPYKNKKFMDISYVSHDNDLDSQAMNSAWIQQCKKMGILTDRDAKELYKGRLVTISMMADGSVLKSITDDNTALASSPLDQILQIIGYVSLFVLSLMVVVVIIKRVK